MGTFLNYYGDDEILETKREEYIKNVKKVLKYGGMVQFDNVKLFDKEIGLISPPTPDENGKIIFHYNIFEDDSWESACFDLNNLQFYTGKVGSYEFNLVCSAIYILTEFYTKSFGLATANGKLYDGQIYIGWLNHILGTKFTNKRAIDPWKIYITTRDEYIEPEVYAICDYTNAIDKLNISGWITYIYMIKNENNLWNDLKKAYSTDDKNTLSIFSCIDALKRITKNLKEKGEAFKTLRNILISDKETIKEMLQQENKVNSFAFYSLLIPSAISLKILCDIYQKDFWKNYEKNKEIFENTSCILFEKINEQKELFPIDPISTPKFMYIPDDSLAFWRTKSPTNYHMSNDDLAYFWEEDGDIIFSKEYENWLKNLKIDFEEILKNDNDIKSEDFLKNMIEILDDVNKTFKRVFAYKDMFYEFLINNFDNKYKATLKLIKKVAQDNKEEGSITLTSPWDLTDRNITFNEKRVQMKRLLALLANKELRKKVFGF